MIIRAFSTDIMPSCSAALHPMCSFVTTTSFMTFSNCLYTGQQFLAYDHPHAMTNLLRLTSPLEVISDEQGMGVPESDIKEGRHENCPRAALDLQTQASVFAS